MKHMTRSTRRWRRSTFCVGNNDCVVVSLGADEVLVRDSKKDDIPALHFNWAEWRAFVAGVKNGEFDVTRAEG